MIQIHALSLFIELVKKDKGFTDAIQAAITGMKNNLIALTNELLNNLFEKNKGLNEIYNAAKTGANGLDIKAQTAALFLFIALVGKDQRINEAIQSAEKRIKSKTSEVQNAALLLLCELVKKDQAFDELVKKNKIDLTIQATKDGMQRDDMNVNRSALNLFKTLINKFNSLLEATTATTKIKTWCKKIIDVGNFVEEINGQKILELPELIELQSKIEATK
ncbi:MAG: hypothetical protein V1646_01190 [bacterium]